MTDLTRKRGLRTWPSDQWLDTDDAMYRLAVTLGLMDSDEFGRGKHVFWSANPVGEALFECLLLLAKAGILEHSGTEGNSNHEFRWNGAFVGTWEPDLITQLVQIVRTPREEVEAALQAEAEVAGRKGAREDEPQREGGTLATGEEGRRSADAEPGGARETR